MNSNWTVEVAPEQSTNAFTHCVACDRCDWTFVRTGQDVHRRGAGSSKVCRCLNCGHIAQVPMPTGEQLSQAYAVAYAPYRPAWKESGWPIWKVLREITTWRRVKRLHRYGKSGKLMELGSGAGDFLYAARRAGWDVCGVEYSRECAEALREATGIDIRPGELEPELWEPGSFDIVVLWSVVEHVRDPLGTLKIVAGYLKPGGAALIQLPTSYGVEMGKGFGPNWQLLDQPRHLNFFSRESLSAVCGQAGMELVAFKTSAVDVAWCYLDSVRIRAEASRNATGKIAGVGAGVLSVIGLLPWMTIRAWRGRGTEAFAVAIKK